MQSKMTQKDMLAEVKRMRKATTCAERRQDRLSGMPEDFIRHWNENGWKDRFLAVCRQLQTHMHPGVCCLPGMALLGAQLVVGKRAMREHEIQAQLDAEREQAEYDLWMAQEREKNDYAEGQEDWLPEDAAFQTD